MEHAWLDVDARSPARHPHLGSEPAEGCSFGIRRGKKQVSLTARQDGHLASFQSHEVALVVTDPRFALEDEVKRSATEAVLRKSPTFGELHAGKHRAAQLQSLKHLIDRVQFSLVPANARRAHLQRHNPSAGARGVDDETIAAGRSRQTFGRRAISRPAPGTAMSWAGG